MRIITLPGVFCPLSDTRLLADQAQPWIPGARVLDVCTGSGYLAVAAARGGARRAVAVDLSRRAVLNARLNARLNGTRVDARRGDLVGPVAGRRFDLVLSNPPYVPAPHDQLPGRGRERAWNAGRDGRVLLDRLIAAAPNVLAPGGRLLLVHSSVCGEEATLARLEGAGLRPEVIARRRGPLGPLLRGRADMLRERGLLASGPPEEELLVVAGVAGTARRGGGSVEAAVAAMPRKQAAPEGDQHREDGGGGEHEHWYRFVRTGT